MSNWGKMGIAFMAAAFAAGDLAAQSAPPTPQVKPSVKPLVKPPELMPAPRPVEPPAPGIRSGVDAAPQDPTEPGPAFQGLLIKPQGSTAARIPSIVLRGRV